MTVKSTVVDTVFFSFLVDYGIAYFVHKLLLQNILETPINQQRYKLGVVKNAMHKIVMEREQNWTNARCIRVGLGFKNIRLIKT